MQAGRELDALIAEKLMGLTNVHEITVSNIETGTIETHLLCDEPDPGFVPSYSTDIASAWAVLDKIHELGIIWCIGQGNTSEFPTVQIIKPNSEATKIDALQLIDEMEKISETSESVPHAICLAALKAVGVEIK